MSLTAVAVTVMLSSAAPEPGQPIHIDVPLAPPPFIQSSSGQPAETITPTEAGPPVLPADNENPAPPPESSGTEIIVTHRRETPGDPLEQINAETFKVMQSVDSAVVEPVAKVYNKGIPRPIRQALRNFFSNLDEPIIFISFLLQLKPGKAAETAGRFAINSTLGLAGFMDVAKKKPFNLPYRPNGFADVLGYYGVGPGPYMYLPIIGGTTVRDLAGDTLQRMLIPAVVGKPLTDPSVVLPMTLLNQLGERAAFDETINDIRTTDRPYATYRELYLRQRQAEIDALRGRETPDVIQMYGPGMPTAGDKKSETSFTSPDASPPALDPGAVTIPMPAPTLHIFISNPVVQQIP